MIKGHILPLGSVVMLQQGEKELVIVGRAQLFETREKLGFFDYSAVPYPNGVQGNASFIYFNDENIQEVIFEGYRSEEEERYAKHYEDDAKKSAYPKLSV